MSASSPHMQDDLTDCAMYERTFRRCSAPPNSKACAAVKQTIGRNVSSGLEYAGVLKLKQQMMAGVLKVTKFLGMTKPECQVSIKF